MLCGHFHEHFVILPLRLTRLLQRRYLWCHNLQIFQPLFCAVRGQASVSRDFHNVDLDFSWNAEMNFFLIHVKVKQVSRTTQSFVIKSLSWCVTNSVLRKCCTTNPFLGYILESWNLKAWMTLTFRFSEKRRSSCELCNSIQKSFCHPKCVLLYVKYVQVIEWSLNMLDRWGNWRTVHGIMWQFQFAPANITHPRENIAHPRMTTHKNSGQGFECSGRNRQRKL